MDTRAMIEERLKLNQDARATLERAERQKRTLDAEEQQTFDKMQGRINDLRRTLDAEALVADEERRLSESRGRKTTTTVYGDGDTPRGMRSGAEHGPREFNRAEDLAFRAWALGNRASSQMLEAADRMGLRPARASWTCARSAWAPRRPVETRSRTR